MGVAQVGSFPGSSMLLSVIAIAFIAFFFLLGYHAKIGKESPLEQSFSPAQKKKRWPEYVRDFAIFFVVLYLAYIVICLVTRKPIVQ